jgi:hypothetical protein
MMIYHRLREYNLNRNDLRCPGCGLRHGNAALSATYRNCSGCYRVIVEPTALRSTESTTTSSSSSSITASTTSDGCCVAKLQVLAASWGDSQDPAFAIDITSHLQSRVDSHGQQDKLWVDVDEDLNVWFGLGLRPAERRNELRLRYEFTHGPAAGPNQRCEVRLEEDPARPGYLRQPLLIKVASRRRHVMIHSALYGSQGGGSGSYNVTELVRGFVDASGGRFLSLQRCNPMAALFGDPCPGKPKVLSLQCETLGDQGHVQAEECDGHLLEPIDIKCASIMSPLVIIERATFGLTTGGIDEQLRKLEKEIMAHVDTQRRKNAGLPVSSTDSAGVEDLGSLTQELESLLAVEPFYLDVTDHIQRAVDLREGTSLELLPADDINELLGNPCPGHTKQLSIQFLVVGTDVPEQCEPSVSLLRRGKRQALVIDDKLGRGHLEKVLRICAPKTGPMLEIMTSRYGHCYNPKKTIDVSSQLKSLVEAAGGSHLSIGTDVDLTKLFGDPCVGARKRLTVEYSSRGLHGNLVVPVRGGQLASDILVGHFLPPHT